MSFHPDRNVPSLSFPEVKRGAALVVVLCSLVLISAVALSFLEAVKTEMQASLLARHGCDEIQGYMIGRPLPVAEFTAFARNYDASTWGGTDIGAGQQGVEA